LRLRKLSITIAGLRKRLAVAVAMDPGDSIEPLPLMIQT
jgi:hypothetical protein